MILFSAGPVESGVRSDRGALRVCRATDALREGRLKSYARSAGYGRGPVSPSSDVRAPPSLFCPPTDFCLILLLLYFTSPAFTWRPRQEDDDGTPLPCRPRS
jgi:hypothetical protein